MDALPVVRKGNSCKFRDRLSGARQRGHTHVGVAIRADAIGSGGDATITYQVGGGVTPLVDDRSLAEDPTRREGGAFVLGEQITVSW
jgi:hypothetical protein